MPARKLKLYLIPKPIGSPYGILQCVKQGTCEIPRTSATLIVDSVNPDTSTEELLKWLKQAPGFVGKWSPYLLTIIEEK